jgi:guanylate kinase
VPNNEGSYYTDVAGYLPTILACGNNVIVIINFYYYTDVRSVFMPAVFQFFLILAYYTPVFLGNPTQIFWSTRPE